MSSIQSSPHRAIIYWLLSGCVLIYAMVVIGCLTRLTHSGLSITDWSFMGSVPPLNEKMWTERFHKYQESPEFRKVNYTMTLDDFKPIFWWEYIHRLTGRIMMYVFLFGFLYFLFRKRITRDMWPSMVLLFVLGAMQAVIGWWMVYSGLQQKPAVSHYRLATHLMSAFTLFAFTYWFALKLWFVPGSEGQGGRQLRHITLLFFLMLVIQIIYGAFTAGYVEGDETRIRPGHIYNTWPKMGGEWMPEQVTMKASFFQDFFENAAGIQFVHRTLAVVIVVLVSVLWYRSNKIALSKQQHFGVTLLIYGVAVQFMLGIMTLLYNVPVALGALHQSGAFFLFGASIYLLFHLYNVTSVGRERIV